MPEIFIPNCTPDEKGMVTCHKCKRRYEAKATTVPAPKGSGDCILQAQCPWCFHPCCMERDTQRAAPKAPSGPQP